MRPPEDEMVISGLKEIVNLGGANAATSLSKLTNKTIKMEVPTLELMDYVDIYEEIMTDDMEVKVILMNLLGDEGAFLYVITPESAKELAELMYEDDIVVDEALINSAMGELGNILINSFLNVTMKVIDMNLITSVPILIQDYFGSILSSVYLDEGVYDNSIFIMQNEFWSEKEKINGSLFFIPTKKLMDSIINNLNKF